MGADIVTDLSTSATSLRDMDTEAFEKSAKNLEAGLECMREPMPTLVFASAYRYIGTHYTFKKYGTSRPMAESGP